MPDAGNQPGSSAERRPSGSSDDRRRAGSTDDPRSSGSSVDAAADRVATLQAPADYAARRPEPQPDDGRSPATGGRSGTVAAVGVGPGHPGYLTRRGATLLGEADVVVGFETVVDVVREETDADLLTCGYGDQAETLATFADRVASGARGVAVLMGDPNHSGYQLLGRVEAALDEPVAVVPGISAVQLAASRARTPLEATTFVTLHQRGDLTAERERLRRAVGDRHLVVLPRPYDLMPPDVAAELVDAGADERLDALVYERLTLSDEARTATTLGDLATATTPGSGADDARFSDLSVLVVRAA